MKVKLISFLLILFILSSCCSKYYICETDSATPLYFKKSINSEQITIIPKDKKVIIRGKSTSKYQKIKYNDTIGWAYIPLLKNKKEYDYYGSFKVLKKKSLKRQSSGNRVHVKGYYRKDGTYVRPHTRRKPK
ncbi:SH3 domain-containing protein [Flavobacterium litorale]|uniref:SH3 domain-containing protein n=1 Tax=Flavobacterium litorale TaxID=2856519 RepID=A0ABX8VC82_9FLAO|nr:SH3 domain-containing protein [Flavobacterium litorale]QYJ68259.1 SH3 domain-containing protein [Flavobacterium litorale]